jgi:parallel beta-helix repeat protein
MLRKIVSSVMLVLLVSSMITLAFRIELVKASGTIYIRADGSIDPPTTPISTSNNVIYTFMNDILSEGGVVAKRDNIVLNGAGHILRGTRADQVAGVDINGTTNVRVENTVIRDYDVGISLTYANSCVVSGNDVTASVSSYGYGIYVWHTDNSEICFNQLSNNTYAIGLDLNCTNNRIYANNMTNNGWAIVSASSDNFIYHNNFVNNGNRTSGNQQVLGYDVLDIWDDGYPSGGNYWSTYKGVDVKTGPSQNLSGSDGIGDTPFFDDRFPLMQPWTKERARNVLITDLARDWHDSAGNPILGSNCTDIISASITGNGLTLQMNMTLNGDIPQEYAPIPSEIDYDFLFDTDKNSTTGMPSNQLVTNDIGVDYFVGIAYSPINAFWITRLFNVSGDSYINLTTVQHSGNTLSVSIPLSSIGSSTSFNWIVFTRETNHTYPNNVEILDKAPDQGHASFSARAILVPDDYPTIQRAIDAAVDGDTIFVKSGTYYENVVANKTLSLIGENEETTIIDGEESGTVVNVTADNVDIQNFTIRNSGPNYEWDSGILVEGEDFFIESNRIQNCCSGVLLLNYHGRGIIMNNYFAYNQGGISLVDCSRRRFGDEIDISRNNITENALYGIYLSDVFSVIIISKNNITQNAVGIGALALAFNIIVENNISWNLAWGISLQAGCYNNTIAANTLGNNEVGMYLSQSSNNTFFKNNLLDNLFQVNSSEYGSTFNLWDDGYPSGGNYWSDYNGTDLYRGSYQNETGSDGIGDTPHIIDANNTDYYPLMNPWIPPLMVPDLAVTNVASSKTVVGQGNKVELNVTIANQGNFTETFNVTTFATFIPSVSARALTIASENVTLTSGSSRGVVFAWNTSGVAYGDYLINAYSWPVSGEINTLNNAIMLDSGVKVTIPGDISGDFQVSLQDLTLLANAYRSKLGDSRWDPNADVDGNGVVGLTDLTLLAIHYGQHYP